MYYIRGGKVFKDKLNVILFLFVLIGVLLVNNILMVQRVTDKVIQNLKRDYVPGPYDPGFDPDKVPPRVNFTE
jgi:hypothetical protein